MCVRCSRSTPFGPWLSKKTGLAGEGVVQRQTALLRGEGGPQGGESGGEVVGRSSWSEKAKGFAGAGSGLRKPRLFLLVICPGPCVPFFQNINSPRKPPKPINTSPIHIGCFPLLNRSPRVLFRSDSSLPKTAHPSTTKVRTWTGGLVPD